MEDEDSESKVKDMWSVLGEQQFKDMSLGNTLKPSIESTYTDAVREEKQLLQYNSVATKDSSSKNSSAGSKIVFKGFKKRILAQAQEIQTQEQQSQNFNTSLKSNKEKRTEIKRGKITEYAQYLGLQPSSKIKCSKCNSPSNSCSTLKQNLCNCNTTMTPMPSTSESSTVPHSPNFKITRKVYLCAACGTYFENWNLFLHMRDIHKRHICLFCLGMFGQAERLSYHLTKKHSVPELAFKSIEDFYGAFKGSCYLVCCTCEKVFSETDNFYNHFCSPTSKQDIAASICTLCRQTGSHASTCSLAIGTNKEMNSDVPSTAQMGTMCTRMLDKAMNSGNKTLSRKPVKNNRSKHIEDGVLGQQKTNIHTKTTHNKIENESSRDENFKNEVQLNAIKDTVSETIMEVSKYIEESNEEKEHTNNRDVYENEAEEKTVDTLTRDKPYDSITETIMEVSRCKDSMEDSENRITNLNTASTDILDTPDKQESCSAEAGKLSEEALHSLENNTVDASELNLVQQNIKEYIDEDKTVEPVLNEKNDSDSHVSENLAQSPISRSLFSPQHESLVSEAQSREEVSETKNKGEPDVPSESQSSVSFNAVASSDRSLVIKICTNRNSQFSVTSATSNDNNIENLDVIKESQENSNTENSLVEEKEYNEFGKEKNSGSGYEVNDNDSDSDSLKLAVVDSNLEEAEEIQETNEVRTISEDKSELDIEVEDNETHAEKTAKEETVSVDVSENEIQEVNEEIEEANQEEANLHTQIQPIDGIILAGEDVPCIDLNVSGTLDSTEIEELLKRCIEAASPFCVYCNHARHIAVNGKQLGLHMLAEHKFQPQHPAIIIQPEQFTARVKKSLDELDWLYFNLDSYSSTNGTYNVPNVRIYECFHCRFHSAVHKELYLHNRKMHQKTILICIMCKSTFYSYSELLCHLCPGAYSPNINVKYRCCLCPVTNLPSAFRLMVHLRKKHHACDVCLESTGNQQRLSNHVWKHKLHHLCYRCGIAYRNKPDITKHLFWKHGTESVLCKKCLQKKWPHIYHFCIPPTAFVCDECSSSFSRAVALKVHKRLHSGDQPYACSECSERFISRKLLVKHENAHKEPPTTNVCIMDVVSHQSVTDEDKSEKEKIIQSENTGTVSETAKEAKETVKKVVDVYDLPPLNLSSESDTDSEDDTQESKEPEATEKSKPVEENVVPSANVSKSDSPEVITNNIVDVEPDEEEKEQGAQIMDGIWDNFKSYTASLEKKDSVDSFGIKEQEPETDVAYLRSIVLADHDYCVVWSNKEKQAESTGKKEDKDVNLSGDQECLGKAQKSPSGSNGVQNVGETEPARKKSKSPKKKKQGGSTSSSDSSSDSDSSSCSCGTNCSCSSSSSGSSSSSSSSSDSDSSTSESSPRKSNRKERKKDKEGMQEPEAASAELENKETSMEMENGGTVQVAEPSCPPQLLRESDLETEETETDEDFYDEHPQQLANKLLAEKRNQLLLLAAVAPASTEPVMSLNNGLTDAVVATPSPDPMPAPVDEQPQQKRKVKTKKRKKGERVKQRTAAPAIESIKLNIPKAFYQKNPGFSASSPALMQQSSAVLTPGVSANDMHTINAAVESQTMVMAGQGIGSGTETENKRSSKRKRVPKRFYGDSSDEDADKQPTMKWRKTETPSFATMPSMGKPMPPRLPFGGKTVTFRPVDTHVESLSIAASATESEEPAESSSDSSDSEVESSQQIQTHLPEGNVAVSERPVNLYCYCQCPYDEVSEMIACDGEDCRIEWFHFECVGIMVPPKGKWYCPDCRKKYGIVQNSEDYFD